MKQPSLNTIKKHLSADPVMAGLVLAHPLEQGKTSEQLLTDLLDAIASQQLSVKAGTTIFNRFKALYPPADTFPDPKRIVDTPDDVLRGCGLSYGKIAYIKGICKAILDGTLVIESLHSMNDNDIIAELVKLKGVGRWTAEMMLIFSFNRPDIFSTGDLGLRTAVSKLYAIDREDIGSIEAISQNWKPYRSYASRLLWKSLNNT